MVERGTVLGPQVKKRSEGNFGAVEAQKNNAGLREEPKSEQRSSEVTTEKEKQKKIGEGDWP